MNISELMNSPIMWGACSIPVILVVVQAVTFAVKAYKSGPKLGLTQQQMKSAMRSSAYTSLGPSIVILSGMLSLLVSMGGPIAWMRLSLIGSVMFESIAAGFGTASVGVTLGTDAMTAEAYTIGVWTMILCSIGWVIFATTFANRMDKVQQKLSGGNANKLMAISGAAMIGAFSTMIAQHLVKSVDVKNVSFKLNKSTVAVIMGALLMVIISKIVDKTGNKTLKEWALTIACIGGMLLTALIPV